MLGGTVLFIFGLIVVLVGLAIAVAMARESEGGLAATAVFVGLIIGGGCIAASTVTVVDTKKIGVVTSYKKPTGESLDAGAHLVKPWESVTEMDGAVQTASYEVKVQLAGGATADVTVYPAWEMAPGAAPELFQQYKSFEAVVESLWAQQLRTTANNIFGTYNPLTNVDPKTGELKKSKVEWANELKAALESNPLIKDKLIIKSVSIPTIAPDQGTQDALNRIVAEFAKGAVLDQQKVNAEKEKEIAKTQAEIPEKLFCMNNNKVNGLDSGTCLGGNSIIVDSRKK